MSSRSLSFFFSACLLVGPVVVVAFYKLRRYSRAMLQAERDALPYDAKPEPKPGILLRRFSTPEQKYLRQLLHTTKYIFPLMSWLTFGIFILPASDIQLLTHNSWNNPQAYLWFRVLLGAASFTGTSCFIFGVLTGSFVITPLRFGTTAQFYRTRPLGLGFLFWTNLLIGLGSELAAILTGAGAALLLLAAIHGPIWLHLPPAFPGVIIPNDGKQELYASLLATSPPRILLSVCTTITLSLAIGSVLLAIPYALPGKQGSRPNSFPVIVMALAAFGLLFLRPALELNGMHLPSWLFVYSELGPPPPYAYALIPVALSAGLLLLARYLIGKSEV
jgi:PSP